jgi:steroid delta-isomerase-like uncharacterized protein
MSANDKNKGLVMRYFDAIWNSGEFEREHEFVALDCVVHAPPIAGIPPGIEGPLMIVGIFRRAVPDLRLTNTVLIGEGDRVVQRWIVHGTHTGEDLFGVPPRGARLVLSGINEFRIEDGKIAERWGTMDVMGMLQQLGVAPDPQQSPPPADADETETRQASNYTMSADEQKLGRRSHDEFMVGGLEDVVDEVYAPNAIIYGRHIPPEQRRGTEGFKSYGRMLRTAFPDIQIVHDSFVTEGDYQAFRWTFHGTHQGPMFGAPPTGRPVSIEGYDILRIRDGKIIEAWIEQDMIGLLQQIGLAPVPAEGAAPV